MVARGWPHDGITPLEVWDLLVEGRSLFARRAEPTFYASLARAALALRRGEAVREAGSRLAAVPWRAVALVGGAVDEPRARAAFAVERISLELAEPDPCFVARLAREALDVPGGGAVVIDVGQTAIKAAGPGAIARLPYRAPLGDRAALAGAVAEAVSEVCLEHRPALLLVGLPCEVAPAHGALLLGASTLPTAGDGDGFAEALRSHLPWAGDVALANDAVLAAWAIDRRVPRAGTRLVLTVGFGVGGAVIASAS